MAGLVAAVLAGLVTCSQSAYQCTSDLTLPMTLAAQKGLALDDTTFHWCSNQIPGNWPNTNQALGSMRIFKAWESDWGADLKQAAWQNLADFAKTANVKVLVGTTLSCNETEDDADWAEVSSLLQKFSADLVMGVSIGNELDLLWQNGASADCVKNMWSGGYFQNKFASRVQDIDKMFPGANIPVTTIFSEFSLAGNPFVDDPTKAMVNTFLTNTFQKYNTRFVFSLNLYPYFDMSNQYFNVTGAVARSTCYDGAHGACLFSDVCKDVRTRMNMKQPGTKFWIAETGWSSPAASTLPAPMKSWTDFSSKAAFKTTYENFLSWDMAFKDGSKGPDHIFYFTMRDSLATDGQLESFGLLDDALGAEHLCQETKCKLQSSDSPLAVVV